MLEFFIASLVTILPDFLYRRLVQGKRWGAEINIYSVWYELRWGITSCAILTVILITVIFYYHPSTANVSSFFRTVTILPEAGGRVEEVFVSNNEAVEAGDPLFKLDDSAQQSAVETARKRIEEVDAAIVVAGSELASAIGSVEQARGAYQQAVDELELKQAVRERSPNSVSESEIVRLENLVASREGGLSAANANQETVEARINILLPAQKATAAAALEQSETDLSKTTVFAGVAGTVEQFTLQPGDYLNPILRPAGILVPAQSGRSRFQAGFGQIAAQVIKVGMVAEITCISKPFTVIPLVVTEVQDVIAAGQIRPGDQLLDIQERARPGTLTVFMEPIYEGQADDVPPGSKCIASAYTNNHDALESGDLGTLRWLFYHLVDTVGVVHALILRIQALLLPVQTLVFTGH